MESEVSRLRREVDRLVLENKKLQENFDEFSLSSHELENELEKELERCEQTNEKLAHQLDVKNDQLESLQASFQDTTLQNQRLQQDIQQVKHQLQQQTMQKRLCESQVDELETQIRVLQATETDLRHKVEFEMESRIFVTSDLEELQKEHELMQERFRMQVLELQSEVFALRHQEHATGTTSTTTPQRRHGTPNQITTTTTTTKTTSNQMQMLTPSWSPRKTNALDQELADDRDNDIGHVSWLQNELQMKDQVLATLQEEITQLTELSQQEMVKKEHLEQELLQVRDQVVHVENLANQIQDIYRENKHQSQQIHDFELENEALKEFKRNLQMENTLLRKTIGDLESQTVTLQQESQQWKQRESQLQHQMEEVETLLTEALTREKLLLAQVDQDKAKIHDMKTSLAQMQREVDQLTTTKDQLQHLIKHQTHGLQETNNQIEPEAEVSSSLSSSLSSSPVPLASPMEVLSDSDNNNNNNNELTRLNAMDTSDTALSLPDLGRNRHSNRSFCSDGDFSEQNSAVLSAPTLLASLSSEQLASKLLEEKQRNALLLSRLQNVCGNVQVFCRVRPLLHQEQTTTNDAERAYGVRVLNHSDVAVLDIKPPRVWEFQDVAHRRSSSPDVMASPSCQHRMKWKVFTFDRVLGPHDNQLDMFREVEPMAQAVVDGFKACILAYGQTGSGKTYTMEGTAAEPGINYRLLEQLFESISLKSLVSHSHELNTSFTSSHLEHDKQNDDEEVNQECNQDPGALYRVELSVMEIYNETVRDLLNKSDTSSSLEIRQENEHGEICVKNLTRHIVTSVQETFSLLDQARQRRTTGHTNVHSHSSRSHSVVMVEVIRTGSSGSSDERSQMSGSSSSCSVSSSSSTATSSEEQLHGKLYLVDLAGSECVKKSRTDGDTLKETGRINKSLASLGDVLEALEQKRSHVPYRNSKLTFLLQDVLQTSSKTLMVVTLSPWVENATESLRSLQLAQRAKQIVVGRNAIRLNKKELLGGKQAYAEIQSLKQQMQVVVRKNAQLQQTLVAMKRKHKEYVEKQSLCMENRVKSLENQCANYKKQNESLQKFHDEMKHALKQERDAKTSALSQNEKQLRQMRQLHANSRVNASHQANVESLLKDRDEEVRKLRNSLLEARRRSSNSVALMIKPLRSSSMSSSSPSKRSSSEPVACAVATSHNENENENENDSNQMEVEESPPSQEDAPMTTPKTVDEQPSPFRRFWNRTARGWISSNNNSSAPSVASSSSTPSTHGVKRRTEAMENHQESRERPQKTTFPPWK